METNIYLECFGRTESQKRYWNEVFATEMNKRALILCDYAIRAQLRCFDRDRSVRRFG